jgi:lipopolysaccharide export system protein LptC
MAGSGLEQSQQVMPARTQPGTRSRAIASARRHSGFVRALKIALPLIAVIMIAGFGLRAWLAVPDGLSVDFGATVIEDGRLVMANPRLDGFTRDNRAYSVVAARAFQDVGNTQRIDLEGISGRLPFDAENWADIEASFGTYDRAADRLDISGGLTVSTANGLVARLQTAEVGIADGSLASGDPVEIELDGSRISADSLSVRDRGTVIVFESRVRMEIDPASIREARNMTGETLEN